MHPSWVPDKTKKASTLNFQARAAIAEKHVTIKLAAMQRAEKIRMRLTTPDDEPSVPALDTTVTANIARLPSIVRAQQSTCTVKHLSLELNACIAFPKMKEASQSIKKKNSSVVVKKSASPDRQPNRQRLIQESTVSHATEHSPSQSTEQEIFREKKPHVSGLHWKCSSGNVLSVEKPVFLTEMEEQVSPSKNVFQNTLVKNRDNSIINAPQVDAESLIISASRLCLASHSSSHRSSSFWLDATITLAGISQQTLEPVLKYFNRSIAEDINVGHVIAALIKALHDLSDAYQKYFFSWVEEQQSLLMNARITSQTDWFDNSLKSSYDHIEKLCFVANEVIDFLEEPDIPAHSKCEQIRQDKRDLENMIHSSRAFDTEHQECGIVQDQSAEASESRKLSQAIVFDQKGVYSMDLGEESLTDDDCDDNTVDVSYEHHVIDIHNESKQSSAPKVSIVVAASRKYLKMKVEMRNAVKVGKSTQNMLAGSDDKHLIPASRIAYLHTCRDLSVAPLSDVFVSEADDDIDLQHYLLGVRGCIALAAGCCKFLALKRLNLQHCMVTVAGCLLLSEAVANCSKLIYVNLGSCIPTSEAGNCEELGVAIANFTKTSKTFALAEFIFAQNSIIGIPIIRWESLNKDINQHLSKLNLSNCMLGSAACNPLSRIIQKCVKLTYLNLRWNKFNADAISQIIDILAGHRHLFELDLSWNSCINNKSSTAIQNLLFKNEALSSLNLSSCNIKPTHATIISAGYMANQTLRKLLIEGNPIGPQGSFALLKVSSSEYNEEARMMSLGGCNLDFQEAEIELFDFLHPSCENKNFDLNDEYDWACVFLLCALRCECALEICTKASLNGGSWDIPGKRCDDNLWSTEGDTSVTQKEKLVRRTKQITEQRKLIAEMIPKTGIVTLSIDYSNPPNIMSDEAFSNNIKLISHTTQEDGSLISKKIVKLAMHSMSEVLITSKQAKEMLAKIEDDSAKAEFIGNMIDKIVDKDEFAPEIDRLPFDIAQKLKTDLKGILAFNPSNASGRYSFDLELFADRIILKKLMEVNVREKSLRQQLHSANTSRNGDWENFRNFALNGHEMRASWQPPRSGKVTCDYTCVIRPPKIAKPIDQRCLEHWIDGLSKLVSVRFYNSQAPVTLPEVYDHFTSENLDIIYEGLSWLSNNFYLRCAQLDRVLHAFVMAGPSIMAHVVQRLFSRVLDLKNFRALLLKYFSAENYVDVMNRLGWLNAANPFEVDGYYQLDLAVSEQREIARFLVDLAVQEPGENWQDETYNEKPFELPKSWTIEVPNKFVLSMTYYTGPNCSLQNVRSQWSKKFLFDSSTTEECDLDWGNDEERDGSRIEYIFRPKVAELSSEQKAPEVANHTADTVLSNSAPMIESSINLEHISREHHVESIESTIAQTHEDLDCPDEIGEMPGIDVLERLH